MSEFIEICTFVIDLSVLLQPIYIRLKAAKKETEDKAGFDDWIKSLDKG